MMDVKTAEILGMINHVSADDRQVGGEHYKTMAIQPWEVMRIVLTPEEFAGFLKGSYIKYAMRAGRKVDADADEDAAKAKHYAQKLSEIEDGYAGF